MADRTPGFAHLHNHTTYSLLDGAQRLDEMIARAAEDGQSSIAITDHGNLFGVLEFAREARKAGVRPIIGIEAYVAPGSRHDKGTVQTGGARQKPYHHLILLAESYAGYKNLIKLATAGFLEGFYYRPRIDKELLRQHSDGIVCLSACLAGDVPTLLRSDRYEDARAVAGEFKELFGPDRSGSRCKTTGSKGKRRSTRVPSAWPKSWGWASSRPTIAITSCLPITSLTTCSSAFKPRRPCTRTTASVTRPSTT
jgi:DNA polymerase-3 subunit alpha